MSKANIDELASTLKMLIALHQGWLNHAPEDTIFIQRFRNLMYDYFAEKVDEDLLKTLGYVTLKGLPRFIMERHEADDENDVQLTILRNICLREGFSWQNINTAYEIWEAALGKSITEIKASYDDTPYQNLTPVTASLAKPPLEKRTKLVTVTDAQKPLVLFLSVIIIGLTAFTLYLIYSHRQESQPTISQDPEPQATPYANTLPAETTPDPTPTPTSTPDPQTITQDAAEDLLLDWIKVKQEAYLNTTTRRLSEVLVEPALSIRIAGVKSWEQRSEYYKELNVYKAALEEIETQPGGTASLRVTIHEEHITNLGQQTIQGVFRYDVKNVNGKWYISNIIKVADQ